MSKKLLEEIVLYQPEFLENYLLGQIREKNFIMSKCVYCKYHSKINHEEKIIHICNDIWSGRNVFTDEGEHIIYCETIDICIECNGFKRKLD